MVCQDAPGGCGTTLAGERAPLDWRAIEAAVSRRSVGRRIIYYESTGSTNDDAKHLAAGGEAEGAVILSDEQTAGRGRAGKSRWITPAFTSIAVSVLLRPELAPDRLGTLAMMAGLAAVEAVCKSTGVRATLKWPNDVLVGGCKLGGILVEAALSGAGIAYAVIGSGLNGNLRPDELGMLPDAALTPTTLLEEVGRPVSRESVVIALLEALDSRYAALRAGAAADLHLAYRGALSTLGRAVTVGAVGERVDGIAEDVTERGALVVRLPDGGRRHFAYGEVTIRTL